MSLVLPFIFHTSPSVLAIGFSVLLVLSLVAAEEVEVRRGAATAGADA